MAQFVYLTINRLVHFGCRCHDGHAGDRLAGGKRQQDRLRPEVMKRRGGVEQILPVLAVCSNMNIDYQAPSQTGNSDRWHEVIYRGRRKNGKPDCRKARYFQGPEPTDCLIELDRFQKTESVLGDIGELFEAIPRIGNRERGTKISAEIRQRRQPIHESRGLRHIIRRDRTPPRASSLAPGASSERLTETFLHLRASDSKEGIRPALGTWAVQVGSVVCS